MGLHSKQFLIGNLPIRVTKDWQTVKIPGNLYLSHCQNLLAGKIKDLNGAEWHLLGMAIQTDKEKNDPLTEIGSSFTDQVKEIYKSWTGRWILVGNGEVHTDCTGLLGCFYTRVHTKRWITSSLAILQEIATVSPRPETLKCNFGIDWYPLPMSRFEEVHKLLPSQILDLKTFHPKQRQLPTPINGLSYTDILEKIKDKLKFSLLNINGSGKKISVALTAGYDSRLILAATRYAGITVKTFTIDDKKISYSDFKLPYRLSRASGYHHKFIKKSRFSKEKEELYDSHTAKNIDHADRIRFSHGQHDSFTKDDLILRGGIFEVARCIYWPYIDSNFSVGNIIRGIHRDDNPESFYATSLTEWIKWVKQTPTKGLEWRDRFYLEQRIAGWLSAIEQGLDLTGTERVHVMNCHDLISLFLSIPLEKRRTAQHHVDLINEMFPRLLQYPFNPPDPTSIRLQKKFIKISKTPLPELYKKLKRRYLKIIGNESKQRSNV